MAKIALAHPGKIGDLLYTLPIARWLTAHHGCKCDIFTSSYCEPARSLIEYQSFVDRMIVPPEYEISHMECGIQPWRMPVPEWRYERVYQLGFQHHPRCRLTDYMAIRAGAPEGLPIYYDHPQASLVLPPRFVAASTGGRRRFRAVLKELARRLPIPLVQIGSPKEAVPDFGINLTGLSFLATCSLLSRATAFVGPLSSQLVLANGFPIPKVVLLRDACDLAPVEKTPLHTYLRTPTGEEVLEALLPLHEPPSLQSGLSERTARI